MAALIDTTFLAASVRDTQSLLDKAGSQSADVMIQAQEEISSLMRESHKLQTGDETVIVPYIIALSFSFAGFVGIFFGFYHARKASGLVIIDALHYDYNNFRNTGGFTFCKTLSDSFH